MGTPAQPTVDAIAHARSAATWVIYFGSALIVGGSGTMLTVVLAGLDVQQQTYVALSALFGILLVACVILSRLSVTTIGYRLPRGILFTTLVPGLAILGVAVWAGLDPGAWPMKSFTASWWFFIGMALLACLLGLRQRQAAQRWLERVNGLRNSGD
jgi:cytochrome bd-type quinol oxidase subunit 2